VELDREEVLAADAVVVVTPHAAFDLDMVASTASYVLDTRRSVPDAPDVEHL
jgi:UDP-N-acetyl-D-mannosaminuronate dehydrogenase